MNDNDGPDAQPPDADESTDIVEGFEYAFSFFQCPSAFSFCQTYISPKVPNPALSIEGLGTVGLPLKPGDALAIKNVAEQAPYGMGERTIIDKAVRDTWELDASKVKFDNPEWQPWLNQVVVAVCRTLGVNYAASQPRCDLYKLLLYEVGSHFLPHVDTGKAQGMFATVIVILPSQYTGGAAHVSHKTSTEVYDTSKTSSVDTTVMAWYTDVTHEIKPITSGYRLALAFNLIHTLTDHIRPALSHHKIVEEILQETFTSWKELGKNDKGPEKIAYLLEHTYSYDQLRGSALKGVDAEKAALLDTVATSFGFHLGLASVEYHLEGYVDTRNAPPRGGWDDSDSDNEMYPPDFWCINEFEMTYENLVDLHDGTLLQKCLRSKDVKKMQTIPREGELEDEMTSGDVDDYNYKGYTGNSGGALEKWYRRTVLILWPDYCDWEVRYGKKALTKALSELRQLTNPPSASRIPSQKALTLVKAIVRRVKDNKTEALSTLLYASLLWDDLDLWLCAIKRCSNGGRPSHTLIGDAITSYGFQKIQPSLDHWLKADTKNSNIFELLDLLQEWGEKLDLNIVETDSPSRRHYDRPLDFVLLLDWVKAQKDKFIHALGTFSIGEEEFLVKLAINNGGLTFFRDILLPQLKGNQEFFGALALRVDMEDGLTPVEERHALAIELLNMAFREEEVFKTLSILPLDSDRLSILLPAILLTVQTLCYTCMYLKRNDLAYKIVEQVIRKQRYIFELEFTRLLLMPFLDFIHSYNTTHPSEPGIPGVQELQASIIYRMFDEIISSSQRWTESQVSSEEFTSVMRSILEQSGPKALATLINSKMTSISRGPEHYIELVADSLANALEDYTSPPRTAEDLQSLRQLIPSVLKVYVDNLRIDSLEVAEEAVTYCFDTDPNGLSGLEYLVGQIFSPPLVEHSSIRSSLVPLVAHIREIGESWEMLDVLAPVFQSIMLLFIQHCLGSKPPDLPPILLAEAKKWTCDCRFCKSIREWLVEKFVVNERTSLLVSGDKVAAHVLRFLSSHCTAVATWKDISNYSQRYHELETSNLEITKKDILYKLQQWQINRDQGLKLLEQISPHEEEQFKLLGEHHAHVMSSLDVTVAATTQSNISSASDSFSQTSPGLLAPSNVQQLQAGPFRNISNSSEISQANSPTTHHIPTSSVQVFTQSSTPNLKRTSHVASLDISSPTRSACTLNAMGPSQSQRRKTVQDNPDDIMFDHR